MKQKPFHILFLCTGNSARSILAEAILNQAGQGRFMAFSAGSQPKGEVHPLAVKLLKRLGHDTSFARSKSWDEFAKPGAPQIDIVITVCDNAASETCPVWPGGPVVAHWGIPDPAAAKGTEVQQTRAFKDAYQRLTDRIGAFVALPLADIDRTELKKKLDAIGAAG